MNKVNLFYPFDKGFFGKTLMSPMERVIKHGKPSKVEMSSIDDFNKHFADKLFRSVLERTPKADVYDTASKFEEPKIVNGILGIF